MGVVVLEVAELASKLADPCSRTVLAVSTLSRPANTNHLFREEGTGVIEICILIR